ncbi:MAG: helix-turn-helix domain-containing protein, partial [Acidobacteriota bacterium]
MLVAAPDQSVAPVTGAGSEPTFPREEEVPGDERSQEVFRDGTASAAADVEAQVSDGHTGVSADDMTAWPAAPEEGDSEDTPLAGDAASEAWRDEEAVPQDVDLPGLARGSQQRRRRSRALAHSDVPRRPPLSGQQRLLLLDTWRRSGLPAGDFAALVGISKHTLYKWSQQFAQFGPAGLQDQPRQGRRGSQLPDLTRRTILMLKENHPEWGCQRISDLLLRGPALPA